MAMATVTMTMVVNMATVLLMAEECAVGSGREGVEGGCGGRELIDMPPLSYRPHSPIQKSVHTCTYTNINRILAGEVRSVVYRMQLFYGSHVTLSSQFK